MDKAVSSAWVLNQLAGMTFPTQGGAYDYMKRCIEDQENFESEETNEPRRTDEE